MPSGYLLILLHAHLPYIRHPEVEFFLEEDWLFEAITETYIPLFERLERLHREGIPVRLTMTWTPPLCEMLADPLLQQRYRRHVGRLLALAEQEVPAKAHSPYAEAAVVYRDHCRYCLAMMDRWSNQLLGWVRELTAKGVLEPITCPATHGFLPLILHREARRAQIAIGVANHRKHFGRDPQGIWLSECGYDHGIEELLAEQGLRYFFLDTHSVYYGDPRPRYGCYAPVFLDQGLAAFARDPESGRQVWSQECGYPGDPLYREFYRDLGYDGEYNYIRNFLHPDGVRRNLGLKYHAVTGKVGLHEKQPWIPHLAFARAMEHGANFAFNRHCQCQHLHQLLGRPPLIVSPYDAELFGHWWYEGPQFLESIFRTVASNPELEMVTALDYLERQPINQRQAPSPSTWGDNGYNGVWLNPANDWIYRHLHMAESRMIDCARRHPSAQGMVKAFLDQMARELLLAQSSDWAFILTTGTSPAYATRRLRDHINRFTGLFDEVASGRFTPAVLEGMAWRDPIFSEIDYRHYL